VQLSIGTFSRRWPPHIRWPLPAAITTTVWQLPLQHLRKMGGTCIGNVGIDIDTEGVNSSEGVGCMDDACEHVVLARTMQTYMHVSVGTVCLNVLGYP